MDRQGDERDAQRGKRRIMSDEEKKRRIRQGPTPSNRGTSRITPIPYPSVVSLTQLYRTHNT